MSQKIDIIEKYKMHEQDTGSAEVQVALLTQRIEQMTGHMKQHPKDLHSRMGLIGMVSRRRRLLKYLKNNDVKRYQGLIQSLGLRH